MLLKQMEYFVTVVEANSFTQAAELLFISQSAVSQQIKLLEQELQTPLLERTNRTFTLTPSGVYFYHQAKQVLKTIEKLKKDTQTVGKQTNSRLRIGYLKCYDGIALQRAIASFANRYPLVELHISDGTHEELYEGLKKEHLDIALNDQRRAFSNRFVNCALAVCHCYVELPCHHPLAMREFVTTEDVQLIPCILISSKEQQPVEQAFYQDIIGIRSEIVFAQSLQEARLLVAANRGFLLREGSGETSDVLFRKVALKQGTDLIQRTYCAFWKKEVSNAYIEELAELLMEEFVKEYEA